MQAVLRDRETLTRLTSQPNLSVTAENLDKLAFEIRRCARANLVHLFYWPQIFAMLPRMPEL